MCRHSLCATVLLLLAGILALAVLGQRSPAGGPSAPGSAPPAWAPTGTEGQAAPGPGAVIATTRAPAPPPVERFPPAPDDGLSSIVHPRTPTGTARVPAPGLLTPPRSAPVPMPAPSASDPVRQAVYLPGQEAPPTVVPTGGIQQVAAPPAPASRPDAPAGGASGEVSPPAAVASDPGMSMLHLGVVGPREITPGQPLVCAIRVRNAGPSTLAEVRVEAPMPPGVRPLIADPPADNLGDRLCWRLGNLEARGERVIKLELQPTAPGEVHLRPTATFTVSAGLRTRIVRPPFSVTLTAPESATPGSTVTFQIQVSNQQPFPVPHVSLRATIPAGLEHPQVPSSDPDKRLIEADIGALNPGKVRTISLPTHAVHPGRWISEVTAYGQGVPEARARTAVQVTQPALSVRLDGPRQVPLHREVTFQVELSNPGASPAEGVRLVQVVPDGLDFLTASTGGTFNPSTHAVAWELGALAAGQRQVVTFTAASRMVGDWALPVTVSGGGHQEARATHALTIAPGPTLVLEVTHHDDPVDAGAETTCEVRAYNQGPAPAGDLTLVVQVPPGLLPVQADGPSVAIVSGQTVRFAPLPALSPRADAVYRIRVRGLTPGQGTLQATLTGPGLPWPVTQETTAHVRGTPTAAASTPGQGTGP